MSETGPSSADQISTRKAMRDSALTVAERAIAQIAQLIVFVLAARVLGPADFGIFALVSAIAIVVMRIAEAAWGPIIMSSSGDRDMVRQVLFLSWVSGGLFMLAALGAIELYALANNEPEVLMLMRLFAVWIWLATFASSQKGVLIQRAQLKSSAICEIIGEVTGSAVTIVLLLSGMGVLALVLGRLAFQCAYLVFGFIFTRLTPKFGFDRALLAEIWQFTLQIFASRAFMQLRLYVATFIVGAFLGPVAVGYYRAAERLVGALAELVAVPSLVLGWTTFRHARDAGPEDTAILRINTALAKYAKGMVAFGVPPFLWLMIMSDSIIGGLLTEEWLPAAPVVSILALARVLMLPSVLTEPLMSLTGFAKTLPIYSGAVFAASIVLTLIGAPFGIYPIAVAQTILGAGSLAVTIWLYRRYLGTDWRVIAGSVKPVLLPIAISAGALFLLEALVTPVGRWALIFEAVGLGLVAVFIYLLLLFVFDRRYIRNLATSVLGKRA